MINHIAMTEWGSEIPRILYVKGKSQSEKIKFDRLVFFFLQETECMKIYHWSSTWGFLFWNTVLPPTSRSAPLPPAAAVHHSICSWTQTWMLSKSQPSVQWQVAKVAHFRHQSQQIKKQTNKQKKQKRELRWFLKYSTSNKK